MMLNKRFTQLFWTVIGALVWYGGQVWVTRTWWLTFDEIKIPLMLLGGWGISHFMKQMYQSYWVRFENK